MAHRSWFPDLLEGTDVVLRRHVPGNLAAFFTARALGAESLSLAVHVRDTNRLIGTCALSQLDSDNGSALYHITIGEKDTWGRGFGTEATRLMLDHAFGTLGLHRIGLSVFSFNERAIRSYQSCGFVIEGRAREAIWRDGRWWDEISMSVLQSDWEALRGPAGGGRTTGRRPRAREAAAGIIGRRR
jgi:RimJ/RimL family protein N-acetyltransferase